METPTPPYNYTNDFDAYKFYNALIIGETLYMSIISCLEIPMICLAIYVVYSLIKSKQAAPAFVINLLISDLIQIICMLLVNVHNFEVDGIIYAAWIWVSFTGVYFMACIAIERYVLIAHPIWHRSHRSIKCLVCTSLIGWLIPVISFFSVFFTSKLICIMFLIPYPVIIVCFVGSCRSLSHSISLSPLKKQLVLGPLFFVVMSYTFLILPLPICYFLFVSLYHVPLNLCYLTFYIYLLNPLVDCLLYVFMRSDAESIIRTPLCCSRLKRVQTETELTTSTNVQRGERFTPDC